MRTRYAFPAGTCRVVHLWVSGGIHLIVTFKKRNIA